MTKEVKDGYIIDYISGHEIKGTPEEVQAVQVFAKQLVEDYGYSKNQIQTRPQFRVKVRPSDTKKEYPVDIAVFSNEKKQEDEAYIIIECKKKNRKDGLTQLKDYLKFSQAYLGVWFNGEERLFLRKIEKNGRIEFEEIPNIPQYGQRVDDIGKFRRIDLRPTHNLKATFKAIRNHLAANTVGATRDEVLAQQLINLIFCKIYDERFTEPHDIVTFRAGIDEEPNKIKERILDLFAKVKRKYKEVLDESDVINLDAKSIAYVVGELQNYCLIEAERDIIADAFETFIGHALKGGQGQFFTPRNVIKMMVDILDPDDEDLIIDPACGSGGFLIEALRHVWRKLDAEGEKYHWNKSNLQEEKMEVALNKIRGIDKDYFLSKVAKAYMAIIGDGKSGIFNEDSLERPENWKDKTRLKVDMGKFSIVITNPPFGSTINVTGSEKLKQFDLGYKWKKIKGSNDFEKGKLKDRENPQILFLERCLQLLKDGGKLGIILPETYLHGPSLKYIMNYLENRHNIFAVVDLPHNTFRPHCNAKTVALFIKKGEKQQKSINFGVAEEMGHNHQGKPIYRYDEANQVFTSEIWDDTIEISKEFKYPSAPENKYVFVEKREEIRNSIYVPRYYWDKKIKSIEEEAEKKGLKFISVNQLLEEKIIEKYRGHGSPPSEFKGRGDIFYIRAGDIVDWDIYKNPLSAIPYEVYLSSKGKGIDLKSKDIIFVKEGSYRVGDVAILSELDTNILLNHHSIVFRVIKEDNKYGIDAFYLLYLFTHDLTKKQLYNKVLIDTTLPNIGDRWKELMLPLIINENNREKIKNQLREAFEEKWKIQESFEKIKHNLIG